MPEPSLDPLDRLEAYYGPPRVARASVFESVSRHLVLALLPIVVLAAAAIAYGLHRAPNYTAEARVSVGRIDLTQPGAITGFATATQALASAYSRAIDSRAVVAPVSRKLARPERTVLRQLSATPVPEAPLIRVTGLGSSSAGAIRLANAGADSLTKYLNDTNSAANPASREILRRFSAAQLRVARAGLAVDAARRSLNDNGDTAARRRAVASAESDLQTAKLQADTVATAYNQSQQGRSLLEVVSVLTRANDAPSDRRSKLQIFLFAALLVGALLGAALATARENHLRGT